MKIENARSSQGAACSLGVPVLSIVAAVLVELADRAAGVDEGRESTRSTARLIAPCRAVCCHRPQPELMSHDWMASARRTLGQLRSPAGGWGYRDTGQPAVEPTVLAGLGLLATDRDGSAEPNVRKAAAWLATLQQADGGVVVNESSSVGQWVTPLAMLLWQQVGGFASSRQQATAWLLERKGEVFPRVAGQPAGHDTSIQGWPWVPDTHPWLEPTAMAVLTLQREGLGDHPRVRDGWRLIRDRAIPGGGWNYGNSLAFGTPLRPQPGPTGLALLALAGRADRPDRIVDDACGYLERTLPATRSPQALCWGLMGLAAWQRRPADSATWLTEAFELVPHRPDPVLQLGYLLMASGAPTFGGDRPGSK